MEAKKATKAALKVMETAAVVKYDLKASEDVKNSSRHDGGHGPHGGHRTNGRYGAMGHNGQKKILKEDSFFW